MTASVYAVATMDTKGDELAFVANCLRDAGGEVRTVDVGTQGPPTLAADISREEVLGDSSLPAEDGRGRPWRGGDGHGEALRAYLRVECDAGRIGAVIP